MKPFIVKHWAFLLICFFVAGLSACNLLSAPTATNTPSPTETSAPPMPTATPAPHNLTVCLGAEPNTLYPFGAPNAAARSVLAAIYDGPLDTVGYEYQPVLLTQLPSLSNGDAQIVSTPVQAGGQIVDADGNVVLLAQGVRVRPSACRADDCILTWDGTTPLQMDQMIVVYRLKPGLSWSDGTPLTADDSVFAYSIASDPGAIANTYLLDRTAVYEATDANTTQWWGLPGFIDPTYFTNFWQPLPKHLWSQFPVGQLPQVDVSSRSPVGWGPYVVQEWAAGDHITLTKNTNYFRAAEGYPKFDSLTFRFISDPNTAISELSAGRCDLLDPTIRLDAQASLLKEMQAGEQAQAFFTQGMNIEWLGLGIVPATYDDGYETLYQKDRPDIFADAHTRQALAYCLDRQTVVNQVLSGLVEVPNTYLPVEHPLYDKNIDAIPFDPALGISLLEQAGWKDTDGNPATPRLAVSVKNVPAGTPLNLSYYTTGATQRRQVTDILAQSLAQCGVGLELHYLDQNDLYASGPSGILFGRRFDLIEYAMGVNGFEPPCNWFASSEIPAAANAWIGANVSGYKNPQFDAACRAAQLALPDEPAYAENYRQTEILFSNDLPAIPLYYRMRIAAARPDFCHFDLDPTANPMWNIEAFDYGEGCQP
ncbi:MAG: peptide ABC transporter substrate-binding protein [Anaerolineales bacterium]|nr:peptide ABC transporter substrate-binding protein [Anaerolineales bacterium]